MRVEHDARRLAAQQRLQGALAGFDRLATQVLAVELDQIECAKDRGRARPVPADEVENSKPPLVGDDRLAVDEQERAGSAATAAAASGKRRAKSWPFRVRSRTPAASRRAITRKPPAA